MKNHFGYSEALMLSGITECNGGKKKLLNKVHKLHWKYFAEQKHQEIQENL